MKKTIALILTILFGILAFTSIISETIVFIKILFTIIAIALLIWYLIEARVINVKVTTNNKQVYNNSNQLYIKKKLMTQKEQEIYNKLKYILTGKERFILQSQVALTSIICKTEKNHYVSELNRTIDFGIFNNNGEVLCLIELNDKTHLQEERVERDNKVKNILNIAQIPLITIWANKENTISYLQNQIEKYIYLS